MSMFGRTPAASSGGVNHERIEMAINEIDMVSDVFNRIVASCHNKCISPRYAEGDLNKGESVCIDRCVAKFFEVNKKVGEKMQSAGANAQATGATSFGL
ncbi:Tim10/DDP family zinc finger-domain-containing protein [Boletus reticuloceps]|uniref:Mitochondrial import inner membrane translocase subunit n=2 Tax=Boletus TaxID=5369 RepID=A0A8I3A6N4_9AGAM|nr:Tim10/DDP family zinc finger-domain-containing protein [Boletus edulis]KAF8446249.1 Tim10/DDP family zinc finger-domain-containing protein [Boletus edulis BED1]KAG6371660.1 Tim10/DDP family zinc finger-domain-containing protein [Boletus reticuloceps]